MKKHLYIKTFGCQMNVYDSNRIADALKQLGYHQTDCKEEADILLLNTCHIREKAADKLFSEVGRLNEIKKKRATRGLDTLIIVAGCVVQAQGKEIFKKNHAIDLAVGPQSYHKLPEMIAEYLRAHNRLIEADFPAVSKFDFLPQTTHSEVSTFLAIQEGCDNFCSYCVVPYTRGCEYSRSLSEIMEEARALVSNGAKEIMLLGQNVNCWHGLDYEQKNEMDLGDLIYEVSKIKGLERIRYTTSYPSKITDNLINAHREIDKLMPYIHLPIQAGSDTVLKAMNRQYTVAGYLEIIQKFRTARPDIAISSDFIVGFPGETDADFEQTLAIAQHVQYAQSYSFKYSPRPGTPASLMKNQIAESVKKERLARLQKLLLEQQKAFNKRFVGQTIFVLFTTKGAKSGQWMGWTPYMQNTHVEAPNSLIGQILPVKITSATASSLSGTLIPDILNA